MGEQLARLASIRKGRPEPATAVGPSTSGRPVKPSTITRKARRAGARPAVEELALFDLVDVG